MKSLWLLIISIAIIPLSVDADTFYWNANSSGNWYDADNWCKDELEDCEIPGTNQDIPGPGDDVIFDDHSNEDCNILDTIVVQSITITNDYTGNINQGITAQVITFGGFSMTAGTWNGSNSPGNDIKIGGSFQLNGGTFISTVDTLCIADDFSLFGGDFDPNNGIVKLTGIPAVLIQNTIQDTLYDLEIDKANNTLVTLVDTLLLNGEFRLLDGRVNGVACAYQDVYIGPDCDNNTSDLILTFRGSDTSVCVLAKSGVIGDEIHVDKSSGGVVQMMALLGSGTSSNLYINSGQLELTGDSTDLDFDQIWIYPTGELKGNSNFAKYSGSMQIVGGTLDHNDGRFVFDNPSGLPQYINDEGSSLFYNVDIQRGNMAPLTILSGGVDTLFVENELRILEGRLAGFASVGGSAYLGPQSDNMWQDATLMFVGSDTGYLFVDSVAEIGQIEIRKDTNALVIMSADTGAGLYCDLDIYSGIIGFGGDSIDLDFINLFIHPGGTLRAHSVLTRFSGAYNNTGGTLDANMGRFVFDKDGFAAQNMSDKGDNKFWDIDIDRSHSAALIIVTDAMVDTLFVDGEFRILDGRFQGRAYISGDLYLGENSDNEWQNCDLYFVGSDTSWFTADSVFETGNIWVRKDSGQVVVGIFEHGAGLYCDLEIDSGALCMGGDSANLDFLRMYIHEDGILKAHSGCTRFSGHFIEDGGTFDHNSGRFVFDRDDGSTQNLTFSKPNYFYDVDVDLTHFAPLLIPGGDSLHVRHDLRILDGRIIGWTNIDADIFIDENSDNLANEANMVVTGSDSTVITVERPGDFHDKLHLRKDSSAVTCYVSDIAVGSVRNLDLYSGKLSFGSDTIDLDYQEINIHAGELDLSTSEVCVSGDLTISGKVSQTSGALVLDGNTTTTITDNTDTVKFHAVKVKKSVAGVITTPDTLRVDSLIALESGKLHGGTIKVRKNVIVKDAYQYSPGLSPKLIMYGDANSDFLLNNPNSTPIVFPEVIIDKSPGSRAVLKHGAAATHKSAGTPSLRVLKGELVVKEE